MTRIKIVKDSPTYGQFSIDKFIGREFDANILSNGKAEVSCEIGEIHFNPKEYERIISEEEINQSYQAFCETWETTQLFNKQEAFVAFKAGFAAGIKYTN